MTKSRMPSGSTKPWLRAVATVRNISNQRKGTMKSHRGRGSRLRFHFLGSLVVLTSLLLSACGSNGAAATSGSSSAKPDRTQGTTGSVPTTSTTSTTSTTAPSHLLNFAYTNPTGWTYSGSIHVPSAKEHAAVDISGSPPGYAKVSVSVTVNPGIPAHTVFQDTNSGRPDGPSLIITSGRIMFRIGQLTIHAGTFRSPLNSTGFAVSSLTCTFGTTQPPGTFPDSLIPPGVYLTCLTENGTVVSTTTFSTTVAKSIVTSLATAPAYYYLAIGTTPIHKCGVQIGPSLTVSIATQTCGSLTASAVSS